MVSRSRRSGSPGGLRPETRAAYGPKTKAERGYALCAGEEHLPAFGDEIILRPAVTAGQAFQVIGFSCRTTLLQTWMPWLQSGPRLGP